MAYSCDQVVTLSDATMKVRTVLTLSKQIFSLNTTPAPVALKPLLEAMDQVTATDFAVVPPSRWKLRKRMITYLHVGETRNLFNCGIFILPQNTVIPLHDHPDMTVLTKVLYGKVCVVSYDFTSDNHQNGGFGKKKELVELIPSSPTRVLLPRQGNIHAIYALADSAMLDVLGPPYDHTANRDCTYYQVEALNETKSTGDGVAQDPRLFEPEDGSVYLRPSDAEVEIEEGEYSGPQVTPRQTVTPRPRWR